MYTLLVTFFLLSIVFSFLCSIWEAVLLSITPSYSQILVQQGHPAAPVLQEFKQNIDRPLAAILTLNTIAHTVGAIGVGAQATSIWGASVVSTAVVPVVMTLAILLLSEIIPKTIGANYWRELAPFTVRSLTLIITLLGPLVFVSQIITRALKKDKDKSVLSRADFTAMAELGSKEGVFGEGESTIIRNLMRFESVLAHDIMTPRTVIVGSDQAATVAEFHASHPRLRFSRIPLFDGSLDRVTGYVLRSDVLISLVESQPDTTLLSLRRDLIHVQESFPIPSLFDHFTEQREQIALVVDEFGGTAGIATLEDVIETLLGLEIVDETDHSVDMQVLARQKWEERARRVGLLEAHRSAEELAHEAAREAASTSEGDTPEVAGATDTSTAAPGTPVQ